MQLAHANVGEDVIVNYVQNSGNAYGLDANQILYLKQQGVSDRIINAMLNQRSRVAAAAQTAPPPNNPDANSAQIPTRPRHRRFLMSRRLRLRRSMSFPTRRRIITTPITTRTTILTTASTAGRRCRSRLAGAVTMAAITVITAAIMAIMAATMAVAAATMAVAVAGITDGERRA